jgi:hypothetical protein
VGWWRGGRGPPLLISLTLVTLLTVDLRVNTVIPSCASSSSRQHRQHPPCHGETHRRESQTNQRNPPSHSGKINIHYTLYTIHYILYTIHYILYTIFTYTHTHTHTYTHTHIHTHAHTHIGYKALRLGGSYGNPCAGRILCIKIIDTIIHNYTHLYRLTTLTTSIYDTYVVQSARALELSSLQKYLDASGLLRELLLVAQVNVHVYTHTAYNNRHNYTPYTPYTRLYLLTTLTTPICIHT